MKNCGIKVRAKSIAVVKRSLPPIRVAKKPQHSMPAGPIRRIEVKEK